MNVRTLDALDRTGDGFTIKVTKEQAPLILELFSRAAISGDKAHLLADLYTQAKDAAKWAGGAT